MRAAHIDASSMPVSQRRAGGSPPTGARLSGNSSGAMSTSVSLHCSGMRSSVNSAHCSCTNYTEACSAMTAVTTPSAVDTAVSSPELTSESKTRSRRAGEMASAPKQ